MTECKCGELQTKIDSMKDIIGELEAENAQIICNLRSDIRDLEDKQDELKSDRHALELLCEGKDLSKAELRAENAKLRIQIGEARDSEENAWDCSAKLSTKLLRSLRKLASGLLENGECEWDGTSRYYRLPDGGDTHSKGRAIAHWMRWSNE